MFTLFIQTNLKQVTDLLQSAGEAIIALWVLIWIARWLYGLRASK